MNEDFEFNENFMENSEFNAKLEEWRERIMVDAIESNYELIRKNGINDLSLQTMEIEALKDLNTTLHMMIEHYTKLEEYEKCKVIFENVKKIKSCINADI